MSSPARRILILDDEDAIRESFSYYFEDQGWEVIASSSAEEAFDSLLTPVDGAIVDLRLPGISGDEFIKISLDRYPQTVFLICTGSPEYNPAVFKGKRRISPIIFSKPVTDMSQLEAELLRLIQEGVEAS